MGLRIAVVGTANTGKSTLVKDITVRWPQYRISTFDYRTLIGDKTTHSMNTTTEVQDAILDGMCAEIATWKKDEAVLMDRCPLDNIAYSLWAYGQGKPGFDDAYMRKAVGKFRTAMQNIDLIVFVPLTYKKEWDIPIVEDGKRETDLTYIRSVDVIFKHIMQTAKDNTGDFFIKDDVPGVLEVFGSREQRLQILDMYIGADGNIRGGNEDDQGAGMGDLIGDMIKAQEEAAKSDAIGREIKNNMIDFYKGAAKMKK